MKCSARHKKSAASVDLFPFLAVLMCTMGSLIVLLVVIARHARVQAAESAQARPAGAWDQEQRSLDARRRELARQAKASEAEAARLAQSVADAEGQLRALWARLAELEAADAEPADPAADPARLAAELAGLQARIAEAEADLERAQRAAAEPPSYAIVPFDGPHGTRRRPIYVECLADRIVIQPEGIELTELDFAGPLAPTNPLVETLAAAREYHQLSGAAGDAYPLLLVRPDGIAAYYVARSALDIWPGPCGYELIDPEWKLAFDPPDEQLADVERAALAQARAIQRRLLATAPRLYRGSGRRAFQVSPRGAGLVPSDGGALDEEASDALEGFGDGGGAGDEPLAAGGSRTRPQAPGAGSESRPQPPEGGSQTRPQAPDAESIANAMASGGPAASSAERRRPPDYPKPDETDSGQPHGVHSQTGGNAPVRIGPPNAPDQALATDQPPELRVGEYPESPADRPASASLAETRGENWALPDRTRGSIPITRPVRVRCGEESLTILPDRAGTPRRVVPFEGKTVEAIDQFRSELWEHMADWGIAGRGMHWRPVLQVEVLPRGEQRCADLENLLKGSGLVVERRGTATGAATPRERDRSTNETPRKRGR
jgi:hypothetical protein